MKKSELKQIIKEEILSLLEETSPRIEELAEKYKNDANDVFIAYNESYWQWEYDTSINHAFLYYDPMDNNLLRLIIINEHIKSGIGKGKYYSYKLNEVVGTINKPKLAQIRSLLKQNGHQRTRAGYPFPKIWQNPHKNYLKEDLTSILKEYQNV